MVCHFNKHNMVLIYYNTALLSRVHFNVEFLDEYDDQVKQYLNIRSISTAEERKLIHHRCLVMKKQIKYFYKFNFLIFAKRL